MFARKCEIQSAPRWSVTLHDPAGSRISEFYSALKEWRGQEDLRRTGRSTRPSARECHELAREVHRRMIAAHRLPVRVRGDEHWARRAGEYAKKQANIRGINLLSRHPRNQACLRGDGYAIASFGASVERE